VKGFPLNAAPSLAFPALFLAGWLGFCLATPAQQPQQPVPPLAPEKTAAPPQNAPPTRESSTNKNKNKIPPFVILGTVFDEKAMAYPGVQVHVRLKGDKKFKWDTYTNSRGEFAVRVPEGPDYEVFVHVKHFQDVSEFVSAKGGVVQQQLSIRMQPVSQGKAEVKK
jgi:hypothetical protein